jgi:hypothetical protein
VCNGKVRIYIVLESVEGDEVVYILEERGPSTVIYIHYYTIRLHNNYTLYRGVYLLDCRCDECLAIDLYGSININQ